MKFELALLSLNSCDEHATDTQCEHVRLNVVRFSFRMSFADNGPSQVAQGTRR